MIVTKTTNTCNYDFFSEDESDGPLYISHFMNNTAHITGDVDEWVAWESHGVSLLLLIADC